MAMTGQRPDEADEAAQPLRPYVPDIGSRPLSDVLGDLSQLAGSSRDRLERLAASTTTEQFEPGAAVISEGEIADAVYVVLAGRARVVVGGEEISELHPGDAFGEIAVLHSTPRTATVTATELLTVCRVPAPDYLAAVTMRPTPLGGP